MINTKLKKIVILTLAVFFINSTKSQNVITLEKALSIAEQSSPEIIQTLLALERSKENLKAQRAGLKSKFSLIINPLSYSNNKKYNEDRSKWADIKTLGSSGTFKVDQPILFTDGTISFSNNFSYRTSENNLFKSSTDKPFSNNINLSYTQPLFTYNRKKQQLKELELSYENTNIRYQLKRLALEKGVTQQYFSLYQTQMTVIINESELSNTKESYEITKNKVDADLKAKEELYQAQLNLSNAQSSLNSSKVSLENAKDDFKKYLGISIYEDITLIADISVDSITINLDSATEYGLQNRMELRQREIDIENSQSRLIRESATNEFKGEVKLSVGVTAAGKDAGNIFDKPGNTPSINLSFNIPLWDWGARESRIKAARTNVKSAQLNLEQERLQIIISIRKIYRNMQNLWTQISIARLSKKNAELSYEINLEKYKNGDLTSMNLKQFQNQLSNKKKGLTKAIMDYKLELLNLKINTLYNFEQHVSIVPKLK